MADTPPHGFVGTLEALNREYRRVHEALEKRVLMELYTSERDQLRRDVIDLERAVEDIRKSVEEINRVQLSATRANVAQLIGILVVMGGLAVNVAISLGG